MRFGADLSVPHLISSDLPDIEKSSLMYTPTIEYMSSLSKAPWSVCIATSQIWVLFDIIRYEMDKSVGNLDEPTILQAKVIACAALHAIIIESSEVEGLRASGKDVREAVTELCAEYGLFTLIMDLSLSSLQAASLLSEIFSWPEINFRYCPAAFHVQWGVLIGLLQSDQVSLQRVAIKMLFNAVQHSEGSQAIITSNLNRKIVFSVLKGFITSCLHQLKSRSSDETAPIDSKIHLEKMPSDAIVILLVEALIIMNSYFGNADTDTLKLSEDEINALSVACGGLVEILEGIPQGKLTDISKSLWTAMINLSNINECTNEFLNTNLIQFLSQCIKNCTVVTTAATVMDRIDVRNSMESGVNIDSGFIIAASLKIMLNISKHHPEKLAETVITEGTLPLLYVLVKQYTIEEVYGGDINLKLVENEVQFQVLALFCVLSCANLDICEGLISMEGFLQWCILSIMKLCALNKCGGRNEKVFDSSALEDPFKEFDESENEPPQYDDIPPMSPRSPFKKTEKTSDIEKDINIDNQEINDTLELRLTLLANICRCRSGQDVIFISYKFIVLLGDLLIYKNRSGVVYSTLSMLISLAPLYHNKNYEKTGKNGTKEEGAGKVAHLLYACLNVSAVSRDLSAIDKALSVSLILAAHADGWNRLQKRDAVVLIAGILSRLTPVGTADPSHDKKGQVQRESEATGATTEAALLRSQACNKVLNLVQQLMKIDGAAGLLRGIDSHVQKGMVGLNSGAIAASEVDLSALTLGPHTGDGNTETDSGLDASAGASPGGVVSAAVSAVEGGVSTEGKAVSKGDGVSAEGKEIMRSVTRVLMAGPRTMLWFPTLLRAAEVLQLLILDTSGAEEFLATMYSERMPLAHGTLESHILLDMLHSINSTLQPHRLKPVRALEHNPVDL
eukprot:CAMPEP_0119053582 /NCGR_PEP_ID=MMETSP1177-20130426/74516_1 /TAXON_ID=2985 /ORGANISM="Ochromonas sp, Strain CCMP1899" /LENGTH=905 /DNA_ID=CAMNT_0007033569 /DNA_START=4244 /DNA_END=6961 /DNA_ORIENTATION=-